MIWFLDKEALGFGALIVIGFILIFGTMYIIASGIIDIINDLKKRKK